MPIIFDTPIMAAADTDKLVKLVLNLVITGEGFNANICNEAYRDFKNAEINIVDFILEHYLELLDLIDRGRSSTERQQYVKDEDGKIIPFVWDEEKERKLTLREMYVFSDSRGDENDETV